MPEPCAGYPLACHTPAYQVEPSDETLVGVPLRPDGRVDMFKAWATGLMDTHWQAVRRVQLRRQARSQI